MSPGLWSEITVGLMTGGQLEHLTWSPQTSSLPTVWVIFCPASFTAYYLQSTTSKYVPPVWQVNQTLALAVSERHLEEAEPSRKTLTQSDTLWLLMLPLCTISYVKPWQLIKWGRSGPQLTKMFLLRLCDNHDIHANSRALMHFYCMINLFFFYRASLDYDFNGYNSHCLNFSAISLACDT